MTTRAPTANDAAAVALLRALHRADGDNPGLVETAVAVLGVTLAAVFEATPGVERGRRSEPDSAGRTRFAGVLVGAVGEQDFAQRYDALTKTNEFKLADHTKEGTDTDFLTEDALARPAFRVNVKMYGARFRQSRLSVNLEPEDTFGVATYKVRQAFRKSQTEAIPYLFAIASSEKLQARDVAAALPEEVLHILDTKTLYANVAGWKEVEDRLVAHLLDPEGHGTSALIRGLREAVATVDYRLISAVKANHLMNELLDERVPAVSNPSFKVAVNSQPNMHFSLSEDMVGLAELVELLETRGIQHVATKIAYHEI